MLTTTIRPSAGLARLAGFDVVRDPLRARQVSSVVFQEAVVDRALTGRQHLALHAKLWGAGGAAQQRRHAAELIDGFRLDAIIDRPVATYSGGQRRRLEVARALVSQPLVLFLDEPTVGLDTRIRYELLDLLAELRGRNEMTTVVTTHYLDEAERLCDRIAVLHAGTIVALDTPANLLARLGEEVLEARVSGDAKSVLALLRQRRLANERAFAVGATVTIPLRSQAVQPVIDELTAMDIATSGLARRKPTLDDVYLQLTGASLDA
jgi:ABC-2 type transport system ATP-binding protein